MSDNTEIKLSLLENSHAFICEAIEYAVYNGAKVLSNSWGGSQYSQSLKDVIAGAEGNGVLLVAAAVGLLVAGLVLLFDNWDAVIKAFKSGFGIFDAVANFFGDDDVEVKKTVDITSRQAPNAANVAAQQVQFNGQLNIAGAPEGSTVSSETDGAPPIRMELAGANP